jgi:hypothetical protein
MNLSKLLVVGFSVAVSTIAFSCDASDYYKPIMKGNEEKLNEMYERNAERDELRRANENWMVDCVVDKVTAAKRCFAGTFGRQLGYDGNPVGSNSYPFQVYYIDNRGPFIMVGHHTYPDRTPIVRIDDAPPMKVHDDGGVSPLKPNPKIVEKLRSGSVAIGRYHSWPDGSNDIFVDIAGFDEAWGRLQKNMRE